VTATVNAAALLSETRPIAAHLLIIQLLNVAIQTAYPFIDLAVRRAGEIDGSSGGKSSVPISSAISLSRLLSRYRGLILHCVKSLPFEKALTATQKSGVGTIDLFLSRFRARRNADLGRVDSFGRWTVYSQAFRVLHAMPPATLRRAERLYSTKFIGEHAQDAGGPYRESFGMYAQELQSAALPLLLRSPNQIQDVGLCRDAWILNPQAVSSTHLEMFAFLGKLMGIALRSKEFLALNIAPIIWLAATVCFMCPVELIA
jgi:hypothetical protein